MANQRLCEYSATKVVVDILRRAGVREFFKGFWLSNFGIFLFTGTDLMVYENIKHRLQQELIKRSGADNGEPANLPWTVNIVSAVCSSCVGSIVAYPYSMITTRIQVNEGQFVFVCVGISTGVKARGNRGSCPPLREIF